MYFLLLYAFIIRITNPLYLTYYYTGVSHEIYNYYYNIIIII